MASFDNSVKLDIVEGGLDGVPVHGSMNVLSPTSTNFGDNNFSSSINMGDNNFNTLDEPIHDTIMRDLKNVYTKFTHVIHPTEKKSLLKEWDLWGPLLLCTFMAMILQGDENVNDFHDGGPQFAEVFVIVWVGSLIVTLNSKLLGGNISFFQSVCVLGYCLLPMAVALILCKIVVVIHNDIINGAYTIVFNFLCCGITVTAMHWTCKAAWKFLSDVHPEEKKTLAMYPIFLFYAIIGWLVLSYAVSSNNIAPVTKAPRTTISSTYAPSNFHNSSKIVNK